jgi:hypothetical protein
MNTRTTVFLAFLVTVLGLLYYIVQTRPVAAVNPSDALPSTLTAATSRKLIETELGDVVKVVVKRKGSEADWVFEKNDDPDGGGTAVWKMISPHEMTCLRWEIDRFGSELGNLQYELVYRPGEPGSVTAEQAGLDLPEAVITITDDEGRTASVEVGKPASDRETYVRLAGDNRVVVGKSNLRSLLKDRPLDFRDKQIWTIAADKVTHIEIEENAGGGGKYAFVREGENWMIVSPVNAKATGKIAEMLNSISRLRVTDWVSDQEERLAGLGLRPAARTVRLTVEERVETPPTNHEGSSEPSETDGGQEQTEPEIRTTMYTLHIADRSPIGEETKVYVRTDDGTTVGTIMKTVADKCRPDLDQWRDMHITFADVNAATRIELMPAGGQTVLSKADGAWIFEDGGLVEPTAIEELLNAIRDLTAVTFLEGEEALQSDRFGFDQPQVAVRITIPGQATAEAVVVGAFTDSAARLLVYVGRGDAGIVAKVRADDVAKLTRPILVYRDRTISDVSSQRIVRLDFHHRASGDVQPFALSSDAGSWRMTEPVEAAVKDSDVQKLITVLAPLRAAQVAAEGVEETAFGLHDPDVSLQIKYLAVGNAADESEPGPPIPGEADSNDLREFTLSVTQHEGKYFAKRLDRPVVYEVSRDLHQQLHAEFRDDRVLPFNESDVTRFSVRNGETTHTFVRHKDGWIFESEPDLPLDTSRVNGYLVQLRDIRTPRFVRHIAPTQDESAAFGLAESAHEVYIWTENAGPLHLKVAGQTTSLFGTTGSYAEVAGTPGLFLLPPEVVSRLAVPLKSLEAAP